MILYLYAQNFKISRLKTMFFEKGLIMFEKLIRVFKSRKFWAAVIAAIVMVLDELVPGFPFTAEQVTNFVYVVMAYILGTAIEDAGYFAGGNGK